MNRKACAICGVVKPFDDFQKSGRTKAGSYRHRGQCKDCMRKTPYRPIGPARAGALIEDVEFMLTHRESMYMASQRLGMKAATLERYLERLGRPELVAALKANQNDYKSGHNQYTKELYY